MASQHDGLVPGAGDGLVRDGEPVLRRQRVLVVHRVVRTRGDAGRASRSGDPRAVRDQSRPIASGPGSHLAFLAIPLVAVVLGGWIAARKASPATRTGAAGAGALAGVVFAAAVALMSALASLVLQVHGVPGVGGGGRPAGTATLWVGPAVGAGALFALGWGVLGGALGGLIGGPARVSSAQSWSPARGDAPERGGSMEAPEAPEEG